MDILALNCGSSSVKYQLYNWSDRKVIAKGMVERIGIGDSFIIHEVPGRDTYKDEYECSDHESAINLIVKTLTSSEVGVIADLKSISAVGHRVVHGGEKFVCSVLIDDAVIRGIEDVQDLAPLHNPPNLAGIRAAERLMPGVPQVAIFDTAFHQTMPRSSFMYAIPYHLYEDHGIRRYGFHGTSHLYVSKRAAALLGKPATQCNIITMHVGNGVSSCAIKNGISVDTSMGLTPLEGLMMGTRSGDVDPALPMYLINRMGMSVNEADSLLNKQSGILGITGRFTDRRDVIENAQANPSDPSKGADERCILALDMEAYRIRKYIGAYAAALGRTDAIVFTAGVGENAGLIREKALENLEFMGVKLDREKNLKTFSKSGETMISTPDSPIKVYVIPTNEELVFVEDVVGVTSGTYSDHLSYAYTFARPDYQA
ncbi:acetate kinase [Desulfurispirillum indicum]|uniref:Acetate kinase n=1 Tax=Desulfurispirillum indicum (strain ATCC BAA-1389 / DSM 22839 / S5) TaxID=653733 RepID=E6W3J7_DESIS|nr:acetate kinase [Desulfurispirillum indicum]ADU65790.1 acetate kinase [Desulfurispirillum indicum S5]UCZ57726.1 acetate kinase [Desulfurispirillum indicum]